MNFADAIAELQRQEIARLMDAVVPRLETLCAMTPPAFREVIAAMWQRFGHEIVTEPTAPDLVTTKNGRKFITACARPADPMPTLTRDLARLHQAVIAASAERGFYISPRGFTAGAQQYAGSGAPIDLVDGQRLITALNESLKGVLLPQTYKAMCGRCGDIVQHHLGDDHARPCANGHAVAPTIALAMIIPPPPAATATGADDAKPTHRPLSRREIRAHNYRYEARLMKKPRRF
jgi:hypothetical protein